MPSFPIPLFVAALLALLALRLCYASREARLLVLLLAICGLQSLIIALGQHYALPTARAIQPLTASLIPPVAWLAYRGQFGYVDLRHALALPATLVLLLLAPRYLDLLLPAIFAAYGGVICYYARQGSDAQSSSRLSNGELPSRLWLSIGGALIVSAVGDLGIAAAQILGYSAVKPWLISLLSAATLLIFAFVSVSLPLHSRTMGATAKASNPALTAAEVQIWQRVQAYMAAQKPYLDPDLTLSRLARKLGVPAKQLSSIINRATGDNVSRFVNQARIRWAQQVMRDGEPVTQAMLASGFNTKSNFNREFRRIVGQSPSAWLMSVGSGAKTLDETPDSPKPTPL